MRWKIVACAAQSGRATLGALRAQLHQLVKQRVNLLLLPDDDQVELVKQILRKTGFDLQVGQALLGGVRVFHALLDPNQETESPNRCGRRVATLTLPG